jgi:hypothetical protein
MPRHLAITAMSFLVAAILVIAHGYENANAQLTNPRNTEHISGVSDCGRADSKPDPVTIIKPGRLPATK